MKELKEKLIIKIKTRVGTTEECIDNFSMSKETKDCLESEIIFLNELLNILK